MKRIEHFKNSEITIESFGGTGGMVTGSCHKITIGENKFLVDAGMFQGKYEERLKDGSRMNFQPMKNIANGVTKVLETHAHIDHTGRLPIIFKDGFTPRVLATEVTAAFMEPMLKNSAEIQEGGKPQNRLYDKHDVDRALRYVKPVDPFKLIEIGKHNRRDITAEFVLNGHVMGSSSIILRNHSDKKAILFTGDMGKPDQSLCGGYNEYVDRYPKDPIHVLMVESTNFDKDPISFDDKKRKLLESINEVWAGGGNPVFPTLSFHRAQEMMELFHNMQLSGEIPNDCEIVIDAPLAITLLDTFKGLGPNYLSRNFGNDRFFYKTRESSIARFDLDNLTIIGSHMSSVMTDEKLAEYSGKVIIIASGGMGGFGRAVNYMHGNFGKNPKNAILFNCFQVPGTEGHGLLNQNSPDGIVRNKKTGAKIMHLEGFTSHISGPEQTFDYLNRFNLSHLEKIVVTHAKDPSRVMLAQEFRSRGFDGEIILSEIGQVINC